MIYGAITSSLASGNMICVETHPIYKPKYILVVYDQYGDPVRKGIVTPSQFHRLIKDNLLSVWCFHDYGHRHTLTFYKFAGAAHG